MISRIYHFLQIIPYALIPIGFLTILVALPLWAMLHYQDMGLMWQEILADEYYRWRVEWTVFQATVTAILSAILGIPTAWVLARLDFFGRKTVLRLLMLPFVMPTLVAAMGILALFGEQGWLWQKGADTPYLLIYGNIFFNLPIVIRAVYQGLIAVPENRLNAAQTLGANAWQRFWTVEWKAIQAWLWGAMCLVFLYCFSGFGLALLLGGQRYATVEVEVYQLIAYELDMARAGVLVWLVLGITAMAGALYALCQRIQEHHKKSPKLPKKPQAGQYGILFLAWAILAFFCGLPLLAVVIKTIQVSDSIDILWDSETWFAIGNTLKFTACAMILATILGWNHALLARKLGWVRGLTFLPFMVSPVCLAFGVLLLYPEWASSLILLLALYALLAYPFVTKDILAAWDSLPPNYYYASRLLGATRFQAAKRVILPLLMPAFRRGLTLAAATSIGEFAATLFLSRPEWLTLTTLIYQKLGRVGAKNFNEAMILSCFLMVLAMGIFLLLDEKE